MTEAELAQHFVEYLSEFDLYFEAPPGNVDIVAISGKKIIAIEVKKSLNFKVIEQAYFNMQYFHLSYIAVQRPKYNSFGYRICHNYGIGVLEYQDHHYHGSPVNEAVKPRFINHRQKWVNIHRYKDWMKRSIPGMPSGKEQITPFKMTVEELERYVKRHSGCTLSEAIKGIDHHYTSFSGAKSSIYQWLRNGVIDTIILENGKLNLTDKYHEANRI